MMLMPVLLNLLLRIFLLKCGEKPLDSSMGCFSKDNLIHSSESNETSDSTETPSSAQSEKKNNPEPSQFSMFKQSDETSSDELKKLENPSSTKGKNPQ